MNTLITQGIKISVETAYEEDYSRLSNGKFVFAYHISIENCSKYTVQLLRRHWCIYGADGTLREVEGEGVIGLQPELKPSEVHRYTSGCHLRFEIGKMSGTYLMLRKSDGEQFRVQIPEFKMVTPWKLN